MKLPAKKRGQLEKKGRAEEPPVSKGGAMGRLRQFQEERGLEGTDLANPATEPPAEPKRRKTPARKKR